MSFIKTQYITDQGKAIERWRRKATGAKALNAMPASCRGNGFHVIPTDNLAGDPEGKDLHEGPKEHF